MQNDSKPVRNVRLNIHKANVHVSTSLRFYCWCNSLFYLPHNIHANGILNMAIQNKSEKCKKRAKIIAEEKEWTSVNVQTIENQTKRQKSLFVCVDDVWCRDDVCMCVCTNQMKICAICWLILFFLKLRK